MLGKKHIREIYGEGEGKKYCLDFFLLKKKKSNHHNKKICPNKFTVEILNAAVGLLVQKNSQTVQHFPQLGNHLCASQGIPSHCVSRSIALTVQLVRPHYRSDGFIKQPTGAL